MGDSKSGPLLLGESGRDESEVDECSYRKENEDPNIESSHSPWLLEIKSEHGEFEVGEYSLKKEIEDPNIESSYSPWFFEIEREPTDFEAAKTASIIQREEPNELHVDFLDLRSTAKKSEYSSGRLDVDGDVGEDKKEKKEFITFSRNIPVMSLEEPKLADLKPFKKPLPRFQCKKCSRKYVSRTGLALHAERHKEVGKFTCRYCDKTFFEKGILARHIPVHFPGGFKCQHCFQPFKHKRSLARHEKLHSVAEMMNSRVFCDFCKKSFSQKGYLSEHMRRHLGVKPYTCMHCKMGFANKADLRRHMKTHTKKLGKNRECSKILEPKTSYKGRLGLHSDEKPVSSDMGSKTLPNALRNARLSRHADIMPTPIPFEDIQQQPFSELQDNNGCLGDQREPNTCIVYVFVNEHGQFEIPTLIQGTQPSPEIPQTSDH